MILYLRDESATMQASIKPYSIEDNFLFIGSLTLLPEYYCLVDKDFGNKAQERVGKDFTHAIIDKY